MQKQNIKNSIVSFILIVSTILMPLSFLPKKAEAQIGIAGYTSGLAPAIARLPQCQDVLKSGTKKLFSGIGNLFSDETGGILDDIEGNGFEMSPVSVPDLPNLDEEASSLTIEAIVPAVSDTELKRLQEKSNQYLKAILGETEAINATSSCIQSIGRLIIKMLLQKLTVSTVNWINSGFDGQPAFIQDPSKFFNNIAKNEILQFGLEIDNPELFPFGKAWMQNTAMAFNNKFQDNARYSLNELIQNTNPEFSAETFQQDFSQGGWNAWTAMTQVPANNPLGFKLMADNEIQRRLAGTTQSTAEQVHEALSQANGFLGDQRCVDPEGMTRQQSDDAANAGNIEGTCKKWEYVTPGKLVSEAATQVMGYQNNAYLNVEDLNDAVAAISDALLSQFSSNIMEKGFANIGNQGADGALVFSGANSEPYRSQTEKDYMPSQLSSSWLSANPDFDIRTDFTQALIDEQRTYSDKLALQNKELNSTIDGKDYSFGGTCPSGWSGTYPTCTDPGITITTAFSTSHVFIAGATCPSGWTPNPKYPDCKGPDDPKTSNAYGLMPAIYQLDYCIPGPHPGWENDSRETLRKLVLPQEQKSSNSAGEIVNGAIGTGLNFVPFVGPVLGSIFGVLTGDAGVKRASTDIRQAYTSQFEKLTGYSPQAVYGKGLNQVDINMSTSDGLFYVINSILDRYINIINKTYFSSADMLPTINKEAAREFEQLAGYNQIIKNNKNKILSMKTTVSILGEIKYEVDKLNNEYKDIYGQFIPNPEKTEEELTEEYENELKPQINAFGRLSSSMVNGNDIAKADDLAKQIVLKKDYIYKNLLKGPYGCEKDLEKEQKPFPSAGSGVKQTMNDWSNYNVNSVQRMTYPFPIIYDYNKIPAGTMLPDPWNSGYKPEDLPKMPAENMYNQYGPGFLSFIYFNAIYDCNKGNPQPGEICNSDGRTYTYAGSERLSLSGLINDFAPGYEDERRDFNSVSIGKPGPFGGGPFEKTIGVY